MRRLQLQSLGLLRDMVKLMINIQLASGGAQLADDISCRM